MKCSWCAEAVDTPEVMGKTLIKNTLVPYCLCKSCVLLMPDNKTSKHRQQQNARQDFWDSLLQKLKHTSQ